MRPILFNTEMVRAICDGRKTVTRRIIKPQPKMKLAYISMGRGAGKWNYPSENVYKYWGDEWRHPEGITDEDKKRLWTPPCHTDEILYVRETWQLTDLSISEEPGYVYKAEDRSWEALDGWTWRPSIHMPKEAARLFLKVKNVSIERLQDITQAEVRKEGFVDDCCMCSFNNGYGKHEIDCSKGITKIAECSLHQIAPDVPTDFTYGWNKTVKKDELDIYGWDANPYVWRIEFERIDKED